jgi:hypothetical protein
MTTMILSLRKRVCVRSLLLFAALVIPQAATHAAFASDQVLDWMQITNDTALSSSTTVANPLLTSRLLALVSASMFDAVNGIEPRYRSYHVRPDAPRHASKRAAAVEAAYEILVLFYPTLTQSLTAQRDASIAALTDSPRSIKEGISWGQSVADAIWNWRLTDGFNPPPPPFFGVQSIAGMPASVGAWRPTPPLNAPGAFPQLATTTPWVLKGPSQFRPPPPYALTSSQYAIDYNEIKIMGVFSGSGRNQDQSDLVIFWNANAPLIWVRIALQLAASHGLTLTENAHLFALMDFAMADGFVAVWDAKYRYQFWRPVTAIQNGDADGNPATDPDPVWEPWIDYFPAGTPSHPEYPSAHASVSGGAAFILASTFGNDTPFTATSNTFPGTRSFSSFSAAIAEIADARVFGGIHFRTSCEIGNDLGASVGNYVLTHAILPEDNRW